MATGNTAGSAIGQQQGQETTMAARERYWEEATPEDKIERLRDEVARLCAIVSEQGKVLLSLGTHAHGADGKLMVPMVNAREGNRPLGYFAHDNGIPHRLRKPYERR